MAPIQTFVFLHFGTNPNENPEHCDEPTNLSLLAVPRQQFLEPNNITAPNNIYLEFPDNRITIHDFNRINDFINSQTKPVCLIAHNGNRFHFGILKRHLERLGVDLEKDVLVADGMYAFHDVLEEKEGPAVRQFYWPSDSRPSVNYRLEAVYRRVVTENDVEVNHSTKIDMVFRISHALGQRFLDWADNPNHYRRFAEVQNTNIQEP